MTQQAIAGAVATGAEALPAAGSSFYAAMRILPRPRREAMYAVYAFCRAVDDIADDGGPRDARHAALERWRQDIDRMISGDVPPGLASLAEATQAFGLQRRDFQAVIDGMAMDVAADITAPDWHVLDLYCDRVASAVGRLSVRIFGIPPDQGDALAHHLGLALQLTNILRDVDEDAAIGRLYLPREALAAAEMTDLSPPAVLTHPGLAQACAEVAARAASHFAEADRIMAGCGRRAVRAPRLMAAVYRSILDGLVARGWAAPRRRVSASRLRLLGAFLRYGLV